jgi:hypothetical protein
MEIFNQHIVQTIASKPSQFTWYIQCMILDGLEGNPWALCLAEGPFGCRGMSKIQLGQSHLLSQNRGIQPLYCTNHCFKTIPTHLIHPMHDFGWFGRESMGSVSCCRPIWVCWDVENSAQPIPPFEPEWRYPNITLSKPVLQNHPNSLDTSNAWFWMGWKGIHGLCVLLQAHLHCTSFDAKNSVFVDARLTLRLLPGVKQKTRLIARRGKA